MSLLDAIKTLTGRKILIYADFIDPFCFIGWHTLRPLAEERGIDLEWQGIELNPGTPPEGLPLTTAPNSDLRPGMWASVEGLALRAGIRFPEPQWIPNTRGAHALVEMAKKADVKNPLIDRIYQAYFTRQRDIGRTEILIDLAGEFGFSPSQIHAAVSESRLTDLLEARREVAKRRAFLGLPGFVYKGRNHFGALSKEAWAAIF